MLHAPDRGEVQVLVQEVNWPWLVPQHVCPAQHELLAEVLARLRSLHKRPQHPRISHRDGRSSRGRAVTLACVARGGRRAFCFLWAPRVLAAEGVRDELPGGGAGVGGGVGRVQPTCQAGGDGVGSGAHPLLLQAPA